MSRPNLFARFSFKGLTDVNNTALWWIVTTQPMMNNTPCYGSIRAHQAGEGLTSAQEDEIQQALEEHEALEALFAWAKANGQSDAAQKAYDAATELECGTFRDYEIETGYTPIDELDEAANEIAETLEAAEQAEGAA